MTKLEELTRSLIALVSPTLKMTLADDNIGTPERIRVLKALQVIEDIKQLIEPQKQLKKWDQTKLPLK